MRRVAALALIAPVLAGCGGDEEQKSVSTMSVPTPSVSVDTPQTGTTTERTEPRTEDESASKPASKPYRCGGKVLRALMPTGPVRIAPNPVNAGSKFEVAVTDARAKVAVVSLAGVSDEPISAQAREMDGRLVAVLAMPEDATCGNKLVTVEGDVAAQAYVAVKR